MKDLIAFLQRHILFLYCIYNRTCTASPTYKYINEISQCKGADLFKCISSYIRFCNDYAIYAND